jgi:hypothetical protein
MKNIILLFLALMTNVTTGQPLPKLALSNPIESKQLIKSPINLNKDDICLTLIQNAGMSGFDYYTHYIFTQDGNIKAYKEEVPKPYLKKLKRTQTEITLDEPTKAKLWSNLNSKTTLEFTSYSQKDFYKPIQPKTIQMPCVIDAAGYSVSFIQNNKQQVYSFYAPDYYLSGKCKDESINKKTLAKFVHLLQLWEVY